MIVSLFLFFVNPKPDSFGVKFQLSSLSLKGQFMNCPYTMSRLLYICVGAIHELPHIQKCVSIDNFSVFPNVFFLSFKSFSLELTFKFFT